jgi:WD40 domain-containing protein
MKPAFTISTIVVLGLAVSLLAQQTSHTNSAATLPETLPLTAHFSPDGKHLITTSPDKTVRIWDVQTGKPIVVEQATQVGTWQLVSYKYGDANEWSEPPAGQKRLKHLTATHFTWVAYESPGGKVQSMAGGPYTLRDGAYTETIEYAGEGMTDYLGKKQVFTIQVDGDKLRQSGKLSDGMKLEEVWQRVK